MVDKGVRFTEPSIASAAIDMFSKIGEIQESIKVFANFENQVAFFWFFIYYFKIY